MITLLKIKEDLFEVLQEHFYDANDLVLDHAYCIDEDVLNSYNEEDTEYCDYEKHQLKQIKARFNKIRPGNIYQGESVCPNCDSTSVEFQYPVFLEGKYKTVYQCEHCGTIYIYMRIFTITQKNNQKLQRKEKYYGIRHVFSKEGLHLGKFRSYRCRRCDRHNH